MVRSRPLIGIAGAAGAGKDTVAAVFLALGFSRIGFADALKREVQSRLPRTLGAIHGLYLAAGLHPGATPSAMLETKPYAIRALLQEYGTEVRRADSPDYWLERWAAALAATPGPVVAPDVRFLNEAVAIRARGGRLIHVARPDLIPTADDHASERSLDDWPAWELRLWNVGTVAELQARARQWWEAQAGMGQ